MFISRNLSKALAVLAAIAVSSATLGQDDEQLEEVVVVGSQIKGAAIDTALPVSVITSDDIDILGVDSGVELLENMAEMGLNYFSEQEAMSGGRSCSNPSRASKGPCGQLKYSAKALGR